MQEIYTFGEAFSASKEYFNGNELAADKFVNKYALRDSDGNYYEKTPEDMHRRIAKEFVRIERKKYKDTDIEPFTEEEIFNLLDKFKKIIPQGSPMFGIGNKEQYVSLANCFVIPGPEDSYGGICRADEEIAQISKRRGGVGSDLSNLRPNHTPTTNSSGTSTGIIPFMRRFSNTTREVGQSGRRGATIQTISIHHPESVIPWDDKIDGKPYNIEINNGEYGRFTISSKYFNPDKIDFVTSKYDPTKVTGSNISLRITDEFMEAVKKGTIYQQRWPVDSNHSQVIKEVDAREAWDKIIHSAFCVAEPGVLFFDTILRESISDCYASWGFATIGVNPCAELILSAYGSCILMLLNLFGFVKNPYTKDASFDYEDFYEHVKITQRLADDLIDLEEESLKRIIKKVRNDPEDSFIKARELHLWQKVREALLKGRRTGTGLTALADTLAALGIEYGSNKGIKTAQRIFRTFKFAAYQSSVDIAKILEPFEIWNHALEKDNPFLNRMKEEEIQLGDKIVKGSDLYKDMEKNGRRNIALLTLAPAGTVSLLASLKNSFGTSSGIEPQYSTETIIRRTKINENDQNSRVDFVDQNGDRWQHFEVYPEAMYEWMELNNKKDLTNSPWHNNTAEELDWKMRVKLQGIVQKEICHGISSTINLPSDVTVDKVKEIYETAYQYGCKGITIYRDGCRSGVLIKNATSISSENTITKNKSPKRPKELLCDIHHIAVKGEQYFVAVGIFGNDKDPYEVFAGKNGNIPKNIKQGYVIKIKRGKYNLKLENNDIIENIIQYENHEEEVTTRLISTALRHGADIEFIVHQLEKTQGDLTSFAKSISRALKKYIKDGTTLKGEECQICHGELQRKEGCVFCVSCGWSRCS